MYSYQAPLSAVLAQLGLKATALAWPEAALAFLNLRPGQSHQPRLGLAQAAAFVCKMFKFRLYRKLIRTMLQSLLMQ
jgi:hypothetical protein